MASLGKYRRINDRIDASRIYHKKNVKTGVVSQRAILKKEAEQEIAEACWGESDSD